MSIQKYNNWGFNTFNQALPESAPYAIVETLEPFSGKVYFEAPSVSFIGLLGDDKVDLVFEMYGGAGDGDCDGGKKLTISDFSLYSNLDTNGYDTTTSDGVLGKSATICILVFLSIDYLQQFVFAHLIPFISILNESRCCLVFDKGFSIS